MAATRKGWRERARRLVRRLLPPAVELPPELRRAVALAYPTLDLGAVRFHLGLPHVFPLVSTQGVTLPAGLLGWPCRSRIYLDPAYWRPQTAAGIGLVLHEAFHALQVQETGRGLGLLHPFLVLYLAAGAANGFRYAGHPLETPAYEVAGDDGAPFERRAAALCPGEVRMEHVQALCAELAVPSSGLRFWRGLRASSPAAALVPVWIAIWGVAAVILAVGELLYFTVGGGIAAVASVIAAGADRSKCPSENGRV